MQMRVLVKTRCFHIVLPLIHKNLLTAKVFFKLVYLKDIYITLKGIRKTLVVLLLRILLICKFLNITVVFSKKF